MFAVKLKQMMHSNSQTTTWAMVKAGLIIFMSYIV